MFVNGAKQGGYAANNEMVWYECSGRVSGAMQVLKEAASYRGGRCGRAK